MRALALFSGIVAAVVGLSGEHSTRDNIFIDHLEQPSKILAPGEPFSIRCVTPWLDMVNAWKKDDVVIPSGSRFAMTSVRLKSQETKNLFNAFKSSQLSRKIQEDAQLETDSADDEKSFSSRNPADDVSRGRRGRATGSDSKVDGAVIRLEDKLEALAKQKLELWTLKVDQVELSDAGNYSCGGEVDTYFSLKVESRKAERSEESPEESEILTNEGETEYGFHGVVVNPKSQKLVLKCNYTGERYWSEDAESPTYQWYKNQSVISESSKYHIQNEGPASTLTVSSCDVSDAGNYTCKFNNKQEATLTVYMYPTIDHVEGSKIQVQGDPLTLLCKARGAPTPTVTWYKEDAQLETDERIELLELDGVANAKLVIKDLQYQDKGHYVCKAKAANVTRSVEIHVRVKDKYAALWPFLGICAEVAILCTIIFIYERRRTKPEFEDDDDKKESSSRK